MEGCNFIENKRLTYPKCCPRTKCPRNNAKKHSGSKSESKLESRKDSEFENILKEDSMFDAEESEDVLLESAEANNDEELENMLTENSEHEGEEVEDDLDPGSGLEEDFLSDSSDNEITGPQTEVTTESPFQRIFGLRNRRRRLNRLFRNRLQ